MRHLIEHGQITQLVNAQTVSYLMHDPALFFETGYKIVKSQNNGFVPCHHVLHNGMHKVVYHIGNRVPLETMLPNLAPGVFQLVLLNLLNVLAGMASIGFVQKSNTDYSFAHIYVDAASYEVSVINVPLALQPTPQDELNFESWIKYNIHMALNNVPGLWDANTPNLIAALQSPALSLAQLPGFLQPQQPAINITAGQPTASFEEPQPVAEPPVRKGLFSRKKDKSKPAKRAATPANMDMEEGGMTEVLEIFAPRLVLVGDKTPTKVELLINKPEYTLGKKEDAVDGHISFNTAISRVHCRITTDGGRAFVEDLGSANGTYINEKQLEPSARKELKPGDCLQLANTRLVAKEI